MLEDVAVIHVGVLLCRVVVEADAPRRDVPPRSASFREAMERAHPWSHVITSSSAAGPKDLRRGSDHDWARVSAAPVNGSKAFASTGFAVVQSAAVSTSLDLGGLSFLERDIIVTAGGAQTQTVHRSIPWLLVAFVGFAVNSALLAARDLLRRRVRRQLAAVRA